MTVESRLKEKMISEYGSVKKFSEEAGIPYPTLMSILQRGIKSGKFDNIIKICRKLHISIDLLKDNIVIESEEPSDQTKRIMAYMSLLDIIPDIRKGYFQLDGKDLTKAETEFVCDGLYITFEHIRMKRRKESNLK